MLFTEASQLDRLLREQPGLLPRAYAWAYAAAKTRTVQLDVKEADAAGATLLLKQLAAGGRGGGVPAAADAGAVRKEPVLPPGLRGWMDELGVMVRWPPGQLRGHRAW